MGGRGEEEAVGGDGFDWLLVGFGRLEAYLVFKGVLESLIISLLKEMRFI